MATYVVKVTPTAGDAVRTRLVEAKQKKTAIAHVAKDTITAEEATTDDILALGKQDVTLEHANGGE